MKAIIIPNDPLKAYLKKGEMVAGYFNPKGIFDEIDIVSLDDSDLSAGEAGDIAGAARLRVHPAGRASIGSLVFYRRYVERIADTLKTGGADVVIAHNSHMGGFVGAMLGRKYRIPLVIHLHTNLDKDVRAHIRWDQPAKKIFWLYSSSFLERAALSNASRVIAAYKFAAEYALARGVSADKVEVVYHRIDIGRFEKARAVSGPQEGSTLRILCVGRVFNRKNPENIIKSIRNIDAKLTIIGDGPYLEKMIDSSRRMGTSDRTVFLRSVPNDAIGRYYRESDVFASVNDYGGVSKPVMEAMAASLPIVVKRPVWEKSPELVGGLAVVTDGSAEGFEKAFRGLAGDRESMAALGRRGFDRIRALAGDVMEQREADIIMSAIKDRRR